MVFVLDEYNESLARTGLAENQEVIYDGYIEQIRQASVLPADRIKNVLGLACVAQLLFSAEAAKHAQEVALLPELSELNLAPQPN